MSQYDATVERPTIPMSLVLFKSEMLHYNFVLLQLKGEMFQYDFVLQNGKAKYSNMICVVEFEKRDIPMSLVVLKGKMFQYDFVLNI